MKAIIQFNVQINKNKYQVWMRVINLTFQDNKLNQPIIISLYNNSIMLAVCVAV